MILISGDSTIEYGLTPSGQMFEKHSLGNKGIIRTTTDPERFLRWMIQSEVDREVEDQHRRRFIELVKPMWESPGRYTKPGHFDEVLYLKIIEAKRERGILYE